MLRDYYVYTISDTDGIARYVGKGRKGRAFFHERKARTLLIDPTILRASRVHRQMAAELARGREFTLCFEAEGLTQEQAYEKEAELLPSTAVFAKAEPFGTISTVAPASAASCTVTGSK
jgi:hypothetical protein